MIEVPNEVAALIIFVTYSVLGVYLYYRLDDEAIRAIADELGGEEDEN